MLGEAHRIAPKGAYKELVVPCNGGCTILPIATAEMRSRGGRLLPPSGRPARTHLFLL
jgi:hypothetical protein